MGHHMKASHTTGTAVAALLMLAGGIPRSSAQPVGIRVMSFNILQDQGTPSSSNADKWIYTGGTNRRERAVQMIVDTAPDILGLQEAEENQVAELTTTNVLGAYGFYGSGRDNAAGDGLHEGIFYLTNRFVRTDHGVFWLSETPDTPGSKYPGAAQVRIAVWALLTDRHTDRTCFVMSTHFDYQSDSAREYSAGLIRERIGTMASNVPVIVTGDFNLYPYEESYDILVEQVTPGWVTLIDSLRTVMPTEGADELTRHGFTGNTAGDRVDYIFYSPAFTATQAEIVHTSYGGRYPSDHYPVTATLTIEPNRPMITGVESTTGGVSIAWDSVPGMTYDVQESESLRPWSNLSSTVPQFTATGSVTTAEMAPLGASSRFYRVSYPCLR
jgi:endonuclease/exonuclease/phosphatase family metal-dependent hydrolase